MDLGHMRRLRHLPPTHTLFRSPDTSRRKRCFARWAGWAGSPRAWSANAATAEPPSASTSPASMLFHHLSTLVTTCHAHAHSHVCATVWLAWLCVCFTRCYCCAFSVDDKGAVKSLAAPRVRPLALPARYMWIGASTTSRRSCQYVVSPSRPILPSYSQREQERESGSRTGY
jgi:hypothetical protein